MSYNNNYIHRGNNGYRESWKKHKDDRYTNGTIKKLDNRTESPLYGDQRFRSPSVSSPSSRIPSGPRQYTPNQYTSDRHDRQFGLNDRNTPDRNTPDRLTPDAAKIKLASGTDPTTGENQVDATFTKLLHHIDFRSRHRPDHGTKRKNYRVIYEPELDPKLSKNERKTTQKKLRFNGEGLDGPVSDPRKSNITHYFQKPNKSSKKFPFKQLPQAKWAFDKDSLGPPPQTELVVWDLPSTVSEVYLSNYFRSYGDPIKEMKFINDPINAVPLGVATFKFQGNVDKAMKLAKKLISTIKSDHAKIEGVELRIGLNDHKNELLNRKVDASIGKLKAFKHKLEEEEEKKRLKREVEEKKRQQEREKLEKERLEKEKMEKLQKEKEKPVVKYSPNTTTSSIRHNHKIINATYLPSDLTRYIKDRPYIIIRDKYVSTRRIPSEDIKRVLNKYNWTRVLTDRSGFFIVFNSLKECEKCFLNEDGRKLYEFKMFMELNVPAGYDPLKELSSSNKEVDLINEAANILLKDFQSFLVKDVQERVIAPYLLDLLSHDKYPELVEDLKRKDAAKKAAAAPIVNTSDVLKQNALSLLAKQRQQLQLLKLPSFKRREELRKKTIIKKKPLIPMQHALNYTNSDVESGESGEEDDDDEEDSSRSQTPNKRSSTATSPREEDEPVKKKKVLKSLLYDDDGDVEMEEDIKPEIKPEVQPKDEDDEFDYSTVDAKYQPTEKKPITVYQEARISPHDVFDLETLQSVIKDEEDLILARKALSSIERSTIDNLDYWVWKQKDNKHSLEEIAEDVDLIASLDLRLESSTGSFRSDGYKKIPDADKAEYLPHRRKVNKPIKTIQHEGDDIDDIEEVPVQNGNTETHTNNASNNNANNNNIQSSRVNRANNRRFAADITAQLGTETESLSLNALTKRKKPVTFARSAIHNWGLYALEPIAAKEMIIEYVGESIRQQVSDNRERGYLKTGIGSSYLFRVDENTVIDATKKGGIARFINHCCNPSCTAKIIKVEGKKRIVIYALREIDTNEELTYDYKFEREDNDSERIRCLCGAPGCKGYLN